MVYTDACRLSHDCASPEAGASWQSAEHTRRDAIRAPEHVQLQLCRAAEELHLHASSTVSRGHGRIRWVYGRSSAAMNIWFL